jgi:hypothetical protein
MENTFHIHSTDTKATIETNGNVGILLNAIRAGDPSLEKVLFAEDIVYRK